MRVFSKLAESFVAMVGRRAAGAGAYCQSIEMTVVQTQANDFVLRVRYTLQAMASDGTDHLVLSSILSPLQVENITASGGFAASDHLAAPGPHLFLSTASGQKEREIVVNAVYRWVPGQLPGGKPGPECLVVPDALFWPVANPDQAFERPQCRIVCTAESPVTHPTIRGIRAAIHGETDAYLQLAVCPTALASIDAPNAAEGGLESIVLSPRLETRLDPWDRSRLIAMAQQVTSHFGAWYDIPLPGGLVLVCGSDLQGVNRLAPGVTVLAEPDARGRIAKVNPNFLIQLARPWWGVGCRVVGEGGDELRDGIGLALALDWLESAHAEVAEKLIARSEQLAARSTGRGSVSRFRDTPSSSKIARIALTLHRAWLAPLARRHVKTLLFNQWGRSLDARVLGGELGVVDLL